MSQPRTLQQAIDDLKKILAWKNQLPAQPVENRSPAHRTPTTQDARLPFGLDQINDDFTDARDLRTPGAVHLWLQETASWAHTSTFGSTPNQADPGGHILTILESPYPWETWEEWPEFAQELADAANTLARLIGYKPQPAGLCPTCGTRTWTRMLDYHPDGTGGRANTAWCPTCHQEWQTENLTWGALWELRNTTENIWVTAKTACEIWKPHLDSQHIKDWHRRGDLNKRGNKPYEYPLATINQLTTRLIDVRKRMAS